jgi:hypothetical protein
LDPGGVFASSLFVPLDLREQVCKALSFCHAWFTSPVPKRYGKIAYAARARTPHGFSLVSSILWYFFSDRIQQLYLGLFPWFFSGLLIVFLFAQGHSCCEAAKEIQIHLEASQSSSLQISQQGLWSKFTLLGPRFRHYATT